MTPTPSLSLPLPLPLPLYDRLKHELGIRREALLFRSRKGMSGQGALELRSNDYLALAKDPLVIAGANRALSEYGASASASPLVSGYFPIHKELEGRLAKLHGYPHALLMTSGYAANCSVLSCLPGPGDLVLADRLAHQSILAGMQSSGAKFHRFAHNNLEKLERELVQKTERFRNIYVVTESVFSMDGDGPDLVWLARLRDKYGFIWILDEAHAVGWHGATGAGMLEESGIKAAADIVVGTLGKAFGSQGAYVLAHHEAIIDQLVNHAGEYIYSTFLSPVLAGAALGALDRLKELATERPGWHHRSRQWRERLGGLGVELRMDHSPIIPIPLGDEKSAMAKAEKLAAHGVLVSAIRPPTVPKGTARLRLSLNRNLNDSDWEKFVLAWEKSA